MRVIPVPCLKDNYAYLIGQEGSREVAVVDPSEAEPVWAALEKEGLTLKAILCTHHHPDHVGGNLDLLRRAPGLPVLGHLSDLERGRIPAQTKGMVDGEDGAVLGLRFRAMHIPGHTTGAVAYYFGEQGVVFTGDTLFGAGCGRMFEGTPPVMYASLKSLAELPPQTRVFCGHEYTQKNLEFAAAVEPDNKVILARRDRVAAARGAGRPSVPSTIAEERETNPFLRTQEPGVRIAAAAVDSLLSPDASCADVFGVLRHWKDRF